jgi:hypothetical protein
MQFTLNLVIFSGKSCRFNFQKKPINILFVNLLANFWK